MAAFFFLEGQKAFPRIIYKMSSKRKIYLTFCVEIYIIILQQFLNNWRGILLFLDDFAKRVREISYQDEVESAVFGREAGRLFVAAVLYREALTQIPEFTYYKALERMVERRKLIRLAKGIYIRPDTALGVKEIAQEIIRYYTACRKEKFSGFLAGGYLFEKYDILTASDTECVIYTTLIPEQRRKIQDIQLIRYPLELSEEQIRYAEFVEMAALYEVYALRGDFDTLSFLTYVRGFAKDYDDASMRWTLSQKEYPKHTIAFAERLLREAGCETSLSTLLPGTSKYKLPKIETA